MDKICVTLWVLFFENVLSTFIWQFWDYVSHCLLTSKMTTAKKSTYTIETESFFGINFPFFLSIIQLEYISQRLFVGTCDGKCCTPKFWVHFNMRRHEFRWLMAPALAKQLISLPVEFFSRPLRVKTFFFLCISSYGCIHNSNM